jgi:2-isopropylmalate synthase
MGAVALNGEHASDLIFDWNELNRKGRLAPHGFALLDETLRDGLQNPSVKDPSIDDKLRILHLMEDLKIEHVNVGLPASGRRAFEDALTLCKEVASCKMSIQVGCAGRTVASDIEPIVEISQRTGLRVEASCFIGSSPIRQFVEEWDVALIAKRSAQAIDIPVKAGLPVSFVTEDTTRSRPEVLATLFRAAIEHGATRLILSDTVGHATPDGVRNLIEFTRSVIAGTGARVGIDWHGHNDRGLALANALSALEHGADRVHGTALGVGERVGNPAMELLLLNLRLLGQLPPERDLRKLVEYCETVARAVGWEIPYNYPLVGRDSFRTATGVHAAAIVKAMQKGDAWLVDRVYSGVPAGTFGRHQEIAIGFMSGASNVTFWLRQRGIEPNDALVGAILETAKGTRHLLSDDEIMAVVRRVKAG